MNTFGPPKLVLVRGEGAHVWDADGKEYVDLLGGIAVNALGHAHPALVAAVTEQLAHPRPHLQLLHQHPAGRAGRAALSLVGAGPARVFFTNSGAEANEAAFKLTRRTGRTHLVAAEGAFHGRTMGALALTSKEAYRTPFEPLPGDVTFVPYGDEAALARAVTDETAAVVLEPIQGEAGVVVPPDGYLAAAREITRDNGALLWLDEIQTGIGRTGEWFAGHGRPTPTSSPWPRVSAAASRSAPASASATPPPCSSPATTAPRSAATRSPARPRSPSSTPSRRTGCSSTPTELGQRLRDGLAAEPRVTEVRGRGLFVGLDLSEPRLRRGGRRGARARLHHQQPDSRPCPPRSAPGHRPR